ncbi:MAG: bifunctional tRNA (5-methylaminomethyl-2-thiouridine)(34)-methyltransferase MnmD/FAD-dependent 5-carboxymethylaminomethyl-2-thiouridine(34) oxidoreductase MnmC [Halieaceae bacterium]|jgi:tRNA 5-methylaminomethyl-2-thiouridine biosynthesis bifunctional protein|nr:bifunctional tRNA (5-methylaminomethyl-2-thiouridine)(34)-methyltransferase MnmD/FAD-dependent 5-carboxymethylaminomethyl-2-thiouridine(34) oxidoreductase MnmC [Halieaceae bacterium]
MRRDNTPWQPVTAAAVDWNDSGEPCSRAFGDIYYARDNGQQESRYVFLQGNDLPARWRGWPRSRFCIAETGFGTGLNFLLTWQAWREAGAPVPDLHYLSIEKYPMAAADLARALSAWPGLAPLTVELLQQYPGMIPGQHRLLFEGGRLTLDLWWEDVAAALPDLASQGPVVDAWYLDGFAPARNAAMWQPEVIAAVGHLSRPAATFSTFTAAGEVRRQLAAAGFTVSKVAGYGRKRECLRGRLGESGGLPAPAGDTPWDLPANPGEVPERVIVLGAGLAGTAVAAALARRGRQVLLLERDSVATGGSGNDQGVLYTRLSRRHSGLTDFALQSFRFSSTFYRDLFARGALREGADGALCGSFHQSTDEAEMRVLGPALAPVPELASLLDAVAAGEKTGAEQPTAGYWFPHSGWLHPPAVCRALADHPHIELHEGCGDIRLQPINGGWRAVDSGGRTWDAPCAIVATGTASAQLADLAWLPIQAIRGQTTLLPATAESRALRAVICHEGYIAPARAGIHCIGATFDPGDTDLTLRPADQAANLASLARALPAWRESLAGVTATALEGKVGLRCASPDYLPMVGPVPDRQAFLHDYAALRSNARQVIPLRGRFLPGLYLSTAHGSRGLTSTPLAAELLASMICGEPRPLSRELGRALAPARFIIRDLCRNRI